MKVWNRLGYWIFFLDKDLKSEALFSFEIGSAINAHSEMEMAETKLLKNPRSLEDISRMFSFGLAEQTDREWRWDGSDYVLFVDGKEWRRIGYSGECVALRDWLNDNDTDTDVTGKTFSEVATKVEEITFKSPVKRLVTPKWHKSMDCFRFENVRIRRQINRGWWYAEINGNILGTADSFCKAIRNAEDAVFKFRRDISEIQSEFPEMCNIWKDGKLFSGGRIVATLNKNALGYYIIGDVSGINAHETEKAAIQAAEMRFIP